MPYIKTLPLLILKARRRRDSNCTRCSLTRLRRATSWKRNSAHCSTPSRSTLTGCKRAAKRVSVGDILLHCSLTLIYERLKVLGNRMREKGSGCVRGRGWEDIALSCHRKSKYEVDEKLIVWYTLLVVCLFDRFYKGF